MQDPRALECRGRSEEMAKRNLMVDDQVIDIIKLLGLEGLYKTQSREIDHGLISALVERWRLSLSLSFSSHLVGSSASSVDHSVVGDSSPHWTLPLY